MNKSEKMKNRAYRKVMDCALIFVALLLLLLSVVSADYINACGMLSNPNTVYFVTQDLGDPLGGGGCLIIHANNVTLDCQGHTINYSTSAPGVGIQVDGFNFTTIKNCIIQHVNPSTYTNVGGIDLRNSRNHTIFNNTVFSYCPTGYSSVSLYLWNVNDSRISNNILVQGGAGSGDALFVYYSANNTFFENTLIPNGSNNNGIRINYGGDDYFNNTIISATTSGFKNYLLSYQTTGNLMENTTFTTTNGSVRYPPIIGIPMSIVVGPANLNISFNRIYLNSSLTFLANESAQLTLNGLNATMPHIPTYAPGDTLTFTDCPNDRCTVISDVGGTFMFNVINFSSSYSSREGTLGGTPVSACGSPLSISNTYYVLTQDVNSTGTCFTIAADNVTLDCGGHVILHSQDGAGIDISGRNNINIKNCIINGNYSSYQSNNNHGIKLISSTNVTIYNNTIFNNFNGIYGESSSYNLIYSNNITNNGNYGIFLKQSSNNNNITGNTVSNCSYGNIFLYDNSNNNVISFNNISSSNWYNIAIQFVSNASIYNNTIAESGDGIYLSNIISSYIFNNTISGFNSNFGINVYGGSDLLIEKNDISHKWTGIQFSGVNHSSMTNNLISNNNGYGIAVYTSNNNTFTHNDITDTNSNSINMQDSFDNIFTNNYITSINGYGVSLYHVSNNTFINNSIIGKDYGAFFNANADNNTFTNNSIEGYSTGISFSSSNNNHFINNTIVGNNSYGASLAVSSNNIFTNNTITASNHGADLSSSSNNIFTNNTITSTNRGINLYLSNYNIFTNNAIISTSNYGVSVYESSNNSFIANNIRGYWGVGLVSSPQNNTFISNIITSTVQGIYIGWYSSNNTFYNNLINGSPTVSFYGTVYENFWNTTLSPGPNIVGGPNIGGNFYANPSGNGFSETPSTCSDINPRDGICDSSYTLTTDNIDYLPLAAPPPALGCGILDQPNKIYALTQDISSNGTCFTVAADNVTLDCQGHTINYAQNSAGYGVYVNGHNYVNIKNCKLQQTNNTVTWAHGVYLNSSSYNDITNVVITTTGIYSLGIFMSSSSYNTLSNNIITISSSHGILLYVNSNYNTIYNNNITSINSNGVYLWNSSFNSFYNNLINGTTPVYFNGIIYQNFWNTTKNCSAGPNIVGGQCIGGNFYATPSGNGFSETPSTCSDINPRDGICDSSYTLTTDNIDYLPLAAPPPALGCGILDQPNKIYALTQDISSNGTCFTVAADNVTLDCQGHTITYAINQSGNGIRISGKNHTTVKNCIIIQTNNTVQQAQAFMLDSSNHNQLINNTITTNGSSYSNGINIQSYSTNNTITENRITTFNLQSRGIMFDSYSNKNTISNNNITITASGSSLQNAPFGIVLRTVDNNTITGNRITTTGTYGDGVIILSGNGNNFTDNIISTSGANADALYLFKFESNVENNIFVNNILRAINGFDFISVGASNNTIINMTFNGSSYPTTASFVYDGNISIDSANAIQSPGFFNVSKYLNITNQSSGAWVFLNISYDQPSFDESKLRMYKWDTTSSSWQLLPDPNGVDTVNNIVYANITSFSTFAPLAQLGITPPTITIISPQNVTYNTSIVDFNVSLNEPGSWCGYSLNGEPNVTMTQINSSYFSAVRADLATGQYSIRFSCNDTAGNMNSTGLMYFSTNVTYNATVLNISIPKWSTLDAIMLNITSPVNVSVDVMYDGTIDWRTGQTTGINVDTSSWLANCQPYIWTSEGPECLLPIAIYGDNVASANITINYWYTNIPWAWQGAEMRISRAGKLMFDFSEIPTGIAKRARSVSLYHASRIPLAYGDFVTVYGVDAAGNRISTTIIIPFPPKEEKIITLPEASVSFVINPNCAGTRGEVRATTSADVAVYHEGTLLMVQSVGTAGFFAFTPELPGMYTFVASKEGYQDKTITYKVNDCSATRSTSMFGNILKCDAGVCKLISSITSTYMEGVTVDLSQFKQIISGISKVVDALNTMWKSFTYDSQNGILNISVTRPDFTVEADTGVSTVVETTSVNATIKINTPADVRIPATKIAVPGIEKKAIKRVAYISDGVEKNITDFSIEPGYIVINEELDIKKT